MKLYLACIALLAACATIGTSQPPADWPKLEIIIVTVPDAQMRALCTFRGVLLSSRACALINFDAMKCIIVESQDNPMTPEIRRHEGADGKEGHCQGYDHTGEDTLRRAWEKLKARR